MLMLEFLERWASGHMPSARDDHPKLVRCWDSITDAGPALNWHWLNISYLLGVEVCDDTC